MPPLILSVFTSNFTIISSLAGAITMQLNHRLRGPSLGYRRIHETNSAEKEDKKERKEEQKGKGGGTRRSTRPSSRSAGPAAPSSPGPRRGQAGSACPRLPKSQTTSGARASTPTSGAWSRATLPAPSRRGRCLGEMPWEISSYHGGTARHRLSHHHSSCPCELVFVLHTGSEGARLCASLEQHDCTPAGPIGGCHSQLR